jgi:hypothetical protein
LTDRATKALVIPGIACSLCGDRGSPGLHVPVMTPEGQARLPRICQPCLSAVLGVTLQLLGHAGEQAAEIAVSVNSGQAV